MSQNDPYRIDSLEKLRELYGEANPMVVKTMLDFLHDHMVDFIRRAPFVAISSETEEGLDVSPRGGEAGSVVHILDRKTVAVGDWPGNNKLETISNIITTGRCGLLLLVPKLDVFLRINGAATVTTDPELLNQMTEGTKQPKAAIKVSINQAYFHCGKAFRRSGLWNQQSWTSAEGFPIVGKVMSDLVTLDLTDEQMEQMRQQALQEGKDMPNLSETTPEMFEAMYQKGLKEDLY